jgi:hypothetical protein
LYLRISDDSKVLNSIREHLPGSDADRLVAATPTAPLPCLWEQARTKRPRTCCCCCAPRAGN